MCDCGCGKNKNQETTKIINVKPEDFGTCCACLTPDVDLVDGFLCKKCCEEHEKGFPPPLTE